MSALEQYLGDAEATEALGARLADCCREGGLVIFLAGELGAGKTTLVRGFLRAAGYTGPVRSPTYTLIEPYNTQRGVFYHLDLYRLSDPEELEWIGVRDLFDGEQTCLIEWPERGFGELPQPDVVVHLRLAAPGRAVRLSGASPAGEAVLRCLD